MNKTLVFPGSLEERALSSFPRMQGTVGHGPSPQLWGCVSDSAHPTRHYLSKLLLLAGPILLITSRRKTLGFSRRETSRAARWRSPFLPVLYFYAILVVVCST